MKEALKLALEALQLVSIEFVCNGAHHAKKDRHDWLESCPIVERYQAAITAIKEALAPTSTLCEVQPEQGPLAKVEPCAVCGEGKARLLVLRSCDTCHSEYAGQAEMKVALGRPEQKPVEDVVAYHSDGTRTVRIAPKRPWVGLTTQEAADCWTTSATKTWNNFESALRSKNI